HRAGDNRHRADDRRRWPSRRSHWTKVDFRRVGECVGEPRERRPGFVHVLLLRKSRSPSIRFGRHGARFGRRGTGFSGAGHTPNARDAAKARKATIPAARGANSVVVVTSVAAEEAPRARLGAQLRAAFALWSAA